MRCSVIYVLLLIICASCASRSPYITESEREQLLAGLEQKVDNKVGGPYGQMVLKLDLLELAGKPEGCHSPSMYTSLKHTPMTRDAYLQKINQLKSAVDAIPLPQESLQAELYHRAEHKMHHLQALVRQAQLKPKDLYTNEDVAGWPMEGESDGRAVGGPLGGPFVPVRESESSGDESDILSSFAVVSNGQALSQQLDTLNRLSQVTDALPLFTPLPEGVKTSGFSIRRDPLNGKMARHQGLDLVGKEDAEIYSAAPGIVSVAARSGSYGNLVVINHGFGITTRYAHLKTIMVQQGEQVNGQQLIGIQGGTGRVTAPHLHYEVRFNNTPRNPETFLQLGGICGPA